MTVYIKGASKKALNEKIAEGKSIEWVSYSPMSTNCGLMNELADGSAIKVWEKMSGGSPIAKSYGTWNKSKNKIM